MPRDCHPFKERCSRSYELSNASMPFLKPIDVDTERKELALAAIRLAHEHHSALISLMSSGHYASAAAMMRPIAEASMAAFWFVYAASREAIQALDDDHDVPTIGQMIAGLDDSPVDLPGITAIRALKKDLRWTRFHKYTHGGMLQLDRRRGELEPPFSEIENVHHLNLADHFLLAGLCIGTVLFDEPRLPDFIRQGLRVVNEEAGRISNAAQIEWPGLPQVPNLD